MVIYTAAALLLGRVPTLKDIARLYKTITRKRSSDIKGRTCVTQLAN